MVFSGVYLNMKHNLTILISCLFTTVAILIIWLFTFPPIQPGTNETQAGMGFIGGIIVTTIFWIISLAVIQDYTKD